jgi:hypothetical protein
VNFTASPSKWCVFSSETVDAEDDVAFLDAALLRRAARQHVGDVDAAAAALQADEAAELRVARAREADARPRESLVGALLRVLQEVLDDGRRDELRLVRGVVVTLEDAGELAVLHRRDGVARVAHLELRRDLVGEKRRVIDRVVDHLDGRERAVGHEEIAVVLELPHADLVADFCHRDADRFDGAQEFLIVGLEQREVALVVHDIDFRGNLVRAICGFEFHERRVGDKLRGDEHAVVREHGTDRPARKRRTFAPRLAEIPRLVRDVHADDRERFFGLGLGDDDRRGLRRLGSVGGSLRHHGWRQRIPVADGECG